MWSRVDARLEQALGERCRSSQLLSSPWTSRATWAVSMPTLGDLVVKIRRGDRAAAKTQWCALNLPLLAARGSPVPSILWHGPLDEEWHVVVHRRLPGRSLRTMTPALLDQVLRLVELQADAEAIETPEDRDFSGYIAHVLFEDWDGVWRDAARAGPHAAALCARLRDWLAPAWGLRLPARDFTHNDLNMSNVLTDGQSITGIVDWDEYALGNRAIDLVVLGFGCLHDGAGEMADRLFERASELAGEDGLRCLVCYRVLAMLAGNVRERRASESYIGSAHRVLERLAVG